MTKDNSTRFSVQSFTRQGGRFALIVTIFILVFTCILFGTLLVNSPGKPQPFLDKAGKPLAGSVSEKIFIDINGLKQGMFIKGKDTTNPVLLYLHGGMPDYFLSQKYPTGLEDYFTVVWWEQRGSGLSYNRKIPPSSLTLEQMIADTREVTNYLRQRFGQQKIYLMGHSGGTFIAIQAAAQMPELYNAYIGMAQMSYQLQSEKLAYDYMVKKYKENGNTGMVRKLEASPVTLTDGLPREYIILRDIAMHSLGIGTMHDMHSIITGILLPSLLGKDYTLLEKFNLWSGKAHSGVAVLWQTMVTTDLSKSIVTLKIPVYFLAGKYDYTVSSILAREYFDKIQAPVKGFYTFDHSAHSPFFEEPEKMQTIMRKDVLTGEKNLADKLPEVVHGNK